jgi:predicted  nucleic acid-binding Zn ribbon protein
MYVQEVAISIQTAVSHQDVVEAFDLWLDFYRGSGQAQGNIWPQYLVGNRIVGILHTLEIDSLDPHNDNHYVTRHRKIVEELCGAGVEYRTLGIYSEEWQGPCTCEKSDAYLLKTYYTSIDSALICGRCDKTVPLYRLPIYYDYGYMPILSWQTDYIACDKLQMGCQVGERWALNQMQNFDSQLSNQGRMICKKIEELTAVPTYYFLYNYRRAKKGDSTQPCPSCGQEWRLATVLHDTYHFKCDACRLISTNTLRS